MTSRSNAKQKIESYARSLLDAARGEGSGVEDPHDLRQALKFTPEVRDILTRMEEEHDLPLLEQVFEDLQTLLKHGDNTATVEVTTAVRMDADLRGKVRRKCEEDLGKPVYLVEHVDPKIIGGIILEANGHRRDASVRAQLVNIRKTLAVSFRGGVDA